jgi:cell division transport system permease protein
MFNKHSLIEGAKNLTRSFWLSITAVTVLIVSLSSVAIILILRTSTSFTLRQLDNNVDMAAFLQPDVTEETIQGIGQDLNQVEEIESWRYINSEEAKQELAENVNQSEGFRETILSIDFETDLDYFIVKPVGVEEYGTVHELLTSDKYESVFREVEDRQDFIASLQALYFWTNWIGIAVVIIFSLIAILVMVNILRMAIYNYRGEIEIMRLVGATNSYIQGPFVMQGTYFALIASVVILLVFIPLGNLTANYFSVNINSNTTGLISEIYLSLLLLVVVSTLIGMATSFLATQKYLQQ